VASGHDIIGSVSRRTGLELEHVEQVAGNLAQSGDWPTDPARAVTLLLLALVTAAEPRSAASTARQYYGLAALGRYPSAGKMLQDMVQTFLDQADTNFSKVSQKTFLEIYSNVPAIKLHVPCANRTAEVLFTEDFDAWHETAARHFNIISGKVLFEIAADIVKADAAHP
jgi:hypothetical protein